jgi:ribose 5-phosphate isomerase B
METIFNLNMPIAIGCDHAGTAYKAELKTFLEKGGYSIKDFGTNDSASVDYPDYAHPVAEIVQNHEAAFGILLCGSANGVAITANKHQQVRAALCWTTEVAELARAHNNANIICLPARFTTVAQCIEMLQIFMNTPFEGGRHEARVKKIKCN